MDYLSFKKSDYSLLIFSGKTLIYSSKQQALEPLVEFLQTDYTKYTDLGIFDKYIGRAAALLMTLMEPKLVMTPLISKFGREIFETHQTAFIAEREVTYLMGIAPDKMCQWEKLSAGKTAEELFALLK